MCSFHRALLVLALVVAGCGSGDFAPPQAPAGSATAGCSALTCAELAASCGRISDGCGHTVQCGSCRFPQVCGGAGVPNRCDASSGGGTDGGCTPRTCAQLGADCGTALDGCGQLLECGSCAAPETCGGGGLPNRCGAPAGDVGDTSCTPRTCAQLGAACGSISDGCGQVLDCGGCTSPAICGGAGVPNRCDAPSGHVDLETVAGATGGEPEGLVPVCCAASAAEKADIAEVFRLLNEHRRANGLTDLEYDDSLEQAIQGHCHHMATHAFFDHAAPETSVADPWARARACGTTANGENLAAGQRTAAEVMEGWKSSPGHNANMLQRSFTRVGIGRYAGGPYGMYWGQLFGQ